MAEATAENKSHYEADRLQELESDLNGLRRELRRESVVTTTLGVVVLVALTGYFTYAWLEISGLIDPEELVAVGAGMIDANIAPAREALEQEIERSAPDWTEQLSIEAVAAAPKLRQELEDYIVTQSTATIEEYVEVSREDFRRALREHRDEFQRLITELSADREASDEVLVALQAALNEELGADMQSTAAEILRTVNQINDRMLHLSVGRNLSPDDQLERQALMLVRRIQMEEAASPEETAEAASLLSLLTVGGDGSDDTAPDARITARPDLDATSGRRPGGPRRGPAAGARRPQPMTESRETGSAESDDRMAATLDAISRAEEAEASARAAIREQQEAAAAAEAATELAREATQEAREAALDARKARDELRAAEQAARAMIEQLTALQKQQDAATEDPLDKPDEAAATESASTEGTPDDSAADKSSDPDPGKESAGDGAEQAAEQQSG